MSDLLASLPAAPITIDDEIRCIERELKYRRRVYPHLVATKKMEQAAADREIEVMTVVLTRLENDRYQQSEPVDG